MPSTQTKPLCISRVVGFAQVKEEPEGRGTRSKTRYPTDTQQKSPQFSCMTPGEDPVEEHGTHVPPPFGDFYSRVTPGK